MEQIFTALLSVLSVILTIFFALVFILLFIAILVIVNKKNIGLKSLELHTGKYHWFKAEYK